MFADYNKRGHFNDNLAAYMMYAKSKNTSNYVCNYVDGDDFPQIFSRGCEHRNGEIQSTVWGTIYSCASCDRLR
jgi:hypothetical protein